MHALTNRWIKQAALCIIVLCFLITTFSTWAQAQNHGGDLSLPEIENELRNLRQQLGNNALEAADKLVLIKRTRDSIRIKKKALKAKYSKDPRFTQFWREHGEFIFWKAQDVEAYLLTLITSRCSEVQSILQFPEQDMKDKNQADISEETAQALEFAGMICKQQ